MQRISFLALIVLLAFAAGCATQSRGDIKRQAESTSVTLDAVKAGSDTADRAARTQSESTAAIIRATGEARAQEARAAAELAREERKLEEIRARQAEREEKARKLRAQIEEAESQESEEEAELRRLEILARGAEKARQRANSKWADCFVDIVVDHSGEDHRAFLGKVGLTVELSETGRIRIVRENGRVALYRGGKALVCPKKRMISDFDRLLTDEEKLEATSDWFARYHILDE